MTLKDINRAADLLVQARRSASTVLLPPECRPDTLSDAYAIQNRATELINLPMAGWKIGAASRTVAQAEGARESVSGRLFTHNIHGSPATLGEGYFSSFRNCEVEFVLKMGRELAPGSTPYSLVEIEAAVDLLYPAIEIGDSRLADRQTAGFPTICADNAGGTHLVLGDPVHDWRDYDLVAHGASLVVDGVLVAEGRGGDVMGSPLLSLAWLVEQQTRWGSRVPAGSWIATGSCTGINMVPEGATAVADFGAMGQVTIDF